MCTSSLEGDIEVLLGEEERRVALLREFVTFPASEAGRIETWPDPWLLPHYYARLSFLFLFTFFIFLLLIRSHLFKDEERGGGISSTSIPACGSCCS